MTEVQKNHFLYHNEKVTPGLISKYREYAWSAEQCAGLGKVMDLGCNTGMGLEVLAEQVEHVVGVDVVPAAIAACEQRFQGNKKISLELVEEGDLDFAENSFDAVVAMNLIEHIADPEVFLPKIYRLLKPGGFFIVTTVNRELRLYPWQKPYNEFHYREYSQGSLKKELKAHFDQVDMYGMKKHPPFFEDLVKNASKRKFQLGIKLPLYNNLWTNGLRPLASTIFPKRFPTAVTTAPKKATKAPEKKRPLMLQDLQIDPTVREGWQHLEIGQKDISKSAKLLFIAYKKK